jgi:hypothetical protein
MKTNNGKVFNCNAVGFQLLLYTVYCHVSGSMTGSSSDDWIYWHFGYTLSLNYN